MLSGKGEVISVLEQAPRSGDEWEYLTSDVNMRVTFQLRHLRDACALLTEL